MMVLYYSAFIILLLINIFCSLKNRPNIKFAYLIVLFLIVLFGGNTLNPDYNVYYANYVGLSDPFSEIGYNILVSFFRGLGLDYNIFLFFIASMGFFLINKTVKRYISNINAFFVYYAFYPFLFDVVQIRNFIVLSILVYSLRYLVEEIRYSKIKYFSLILLASLFQFTALVYLPLILIKRRNQRYIIRILVFISISFSIIFLIDSNIIMGLMNVLNNSIEDKRIAIWFNRSTNWGFLYNWILQIINLLFCRLIYKTHFKVSNAKSESDLSFSQRNNYSLITSKLLGSVYWINIYATIFFPFYIMASVFDRFMRNLMLINYIAIICWGENSNVSKRTKIKIIFFYSIYLIFLVIMNIIVFNPNLIDQILYNNIIF